MASWNTSEETKEPGLWMQMWIKLGLLIPIKVLQWLDEGRESHKKHPLLYIMTGLIVSLALASMWNFISRASIHHAGISAYLGGIALAGLVPVTVFFAVYAKIDDGKRLGVWVIAGLFVFLSASIQYPVYAGEGAKLTLAYLFSSKFDLEAFAFGAGNPIAECLLAVMEAMYLNSLAKEDAGKIEEEEREREEQDLLAKNMERERKEQLRRDLDDQTERLRQQKEFEAKEERDRREFELKLEIQKAEALAKIERERIKIESKLATKSATGDSNSDSDESKLIRFYAKKPLGSQREAADSIGLNQSKVNRLLKKLESDKVIHRNGKGVEIL